jgi:integrase
MVILRFLHSLKQQVDNKHIVATTIWNYVAAIKLFCEMNDIPIGWKKLLRGLPRGRNYSRDRAPTQEEIRMLCEYPDRRIKPIVYTMVSSGIRLGAWDYLKWGDITPVKDEQAARVRVYAGEDEEYFTYISGEAYSELKKWMDFRAMSGEHITKDSWLMRALWNVRWSNVNPRGRIAADPRKLTIAGLKALIQNAVHAQGIHTGLEPGKKRYEFKAIHGFRKYFKTHAEQVMKPINVEVLMSHSVVVSDSYYRPLEQDLLEDYLKAVPLLTINEPVKQQVDVTHDPQFLKLVQALISEVSEFMSLFVRCIT